MIRQPFVWTLCALEVYWASLGLGKHINQTHAPPSQLALVLFIEDFIYNTGLTLIKISVLMFYVRVFGTVRIYRIIFWIVGAMLTAWGVGINFLALFTCSPIRKSWDSKTPGHCLNTKGRDDFVAAAVPNILLDLVLLVLPMPMLWRLHLTTPRKFGLVGVFIAGYL